MMVEYRLNGDNPYNDEGVIYEGIFNSEYLLARVFKGHSWGGEKDIYSIKTPNGSFEFYSKSREEVEEVFDGLKQVLCGAPVSIPSIGWLKPVSLE